MHRIADLIRRGGPGRRCVEGESRRVVSASAARNADVVMLACVAPGRSGVLRKVALDNGQSALPCE